MLRLARSSLLAPVMMNPATGAHTLAPGTLTKLQYLDLRHTHNNITSLQPTNAYEQQPVLGIRDILLRIRIRSPGFLSPANGSDSFLQCLEGGKKIHFFHIFFISYQQAPYFYLQALFQSAQHLYEKRERSGTGSGSIPLTKGSGSGRPKNMQIRIPNTGNRVF